MTVSREGGRSSPSLRNAASYRGSVFFTYSTIAVYECGRMFGLVAPAYAVQIASARLT